MMSRNVLLLNRTWRVIALFAVLVLLAAACSGTDDADSGGDDTAADDTADDSGDGGGDADGGSLNVAIVGNPQMEDIASLTPEFFTADTGIEVNYTILEEQTLREIVTRETGAGGESFDVIMIGLYETPQFAENGWLLSLEDYAQGDADYMVDDLIGAVRTGLSYEDELYAAPFYAESSFLMYREDLVEAAGMEMPAAPTWQEVAEIAAALDSEDTAGICLRGKPGWGDLGAAFTTVLNTFGGTWWAANDDGSIGEAQVDTPEFREALQFYVDLVTSVGEDDAANSSFNECLTQYQNGQVAMWYDATVAAGLLEADDSAVQGQNNFAQAPVVETDNAGWLWAWSLAIPQNAANPDLAWEYISWATGPEYLRTAGENLPGGWAAVPPGTRVSLYETEEYQEAAGAFAEQTLTAIESAPIDMPGTTPRPGLPAVQFVGVPEFQDVGTRCTEQFSAVIAGSVDFDDAIEACQEIAASASS
ncbi:Various polyols ABC transporter, periplasmic substrate-binding protein [Euzebya pacifica]|uniref:Various polyols ABC transporter, periplasmic substrate-binding protein n=2 Tax=Euzebya pacifica TaxID=1608957 RepID=A0A346Y2V0_9ACTN|nr:Various polyols ABC transporter, periplasmic substrate-binding protein [Euzebya pacifica]